ncbi:hypothetical protein ACF0H5_008895 [Mactra antiquata]
MSSEHLPMSNWSIMKDENSYKDAMVLGGVGDALGYKNGDWEFCLQGDVIHKELRRMGGVGKINVKDWIVSDDTVMHLATAEALIENKHCTDKEKLYCLLARYYKECMNDMDNRAPGNTSSSMCAKLQPERAEGYQMPFNPTGRGCGAAMRAMCIGLRYPKLRDIEDLIEVSIESGRMTHHHPTGYLGALATALFASYAVQDKPLKEWGAGLIDTLKHAKRYITNRGIDVKENIAEWGYFETKWSSYLRLRNISDGINDPYFPADFDRVEKRDQFYSMMSFDDWGGSSGHDAPMIAYDALLASNDNWEELCDRAMFHGGDCDSTGSIAGCLYGILYGIKGVPKPNYKHLEYRERLEHTGSELYKLASGNGAKESEGNSRKCTEI